LIKDKGLDVSKNIRAIERLKSELLEKVAVLYKTMSDDKDDVHEQVASELSNIILKSYMLGKRLGISYSSLEAELEGRLKLGVLKEEPQEKDFGDYSELLHYLRGRNT
jgi:hypothetical protein